MKDFFKNNSSAIIFLDTWYCINDLKGFILAVKNSNERSIVQLRENLNDNNIDIDKFLIEYYRRADDFFNENLLTK